MAKKPYLTKKKSPSAISRKMTDSHIAASMREAGTKELLAKIKVLPELQQYIAPLTQEEFEVLEGSILSENKVRDKLIVWKKDDYNYVLIDGHHRHQVLTKHGEQLIQFGIEEAKVASLDEAKTLMEEIQLGRRNATRNYISYLRGRAYLREKESWGGDRSKEGGEKGKTRDRVADRFKTSPATIVRDVKFTLGVDRFSDANLPEEVQEERTKILLQESSLTKQDIQFIGEAEQLDLPLFLAYRMTGGTLENLQQLPDSDWNEFMASFSPTATTVRKPVTKKPESAPAKKDRFVAWYEKEDKVIQKIIQKGDEQDKQQKAQELEDRIAEMSKWLEELKA